MTPETLSAVRSKAAEFDVPAGNLAAMVEVESNGKIFADVGGVQRPLILFEPHVFYRRLKGDERDRAVKAGLAYPSQGSKPYPKAQEARWTQIEQGALINTDEAYQSASYGVGQVMGYHWKALGYDSLQAFLDTMFSGVGGQIDAMLRYCRVNHLLDDLREGRWLSLARGYNGKKYATSYAKKLETAAAKFGGAAAGRDGTLRLGATGARVRELQALLNRAGHKVEVDGDFGPATKQALKVFQLQHDLVADGVYGPKTEAALADYRQGQKDKPGKPSILGTDEAKEGIGAAGGGLAIEVAQGRVDEATAQLQQVEGISPWITYGLTALSILAACLAIAGVCWFVWGWIKSKRTVEA